METEERNQRTCKTTEPEFFLQWGNRKRLRCVRVKDPRISTRLNGGGGIRRKLNSGLDNNNNRSGVTFSEKETSNLLHHQQQPNRLTRLFTTTITNNKFIFSDSFFFFFFVLCLLSLFDFSDEKNWDVGFPCWLLKREKKFHFSHSLIDFQ
jgi:hypothetical protein